jgi:hypothetical protein
MFPAAFGSIGAAARRASRRRTIGMIPQRPSFAMKEQRAGM